MKLFHNFKSMEAGIGGPFLVNVQLPATLPLLHYQLERETGEGSRSSPLVVQPLGTVPGESFTSPIISPSGSFSTNRTRSSGRESINLYNKLVFPKGPSSQHGSEPGEAFTKEASMDPHSGRMYQTQMD